MAATPPGGTSQTEAATRRQPERPRRDRLSLGTAALAIATLSLGLWWLMLRALVAVIKAVF
jgi:hypothetical protein